MSYEVRYCLSCPRSPTVIQFQFGFSLVPGDTTVASRPPRVVVHPEYHIGRYGTLYFGEGSGVRPFG
jgi:hypothetical protein